MLAYYSPLLTSTIDSCLEELSEHVRNLVFSLFASAIEEIKEGYAVISHYVKNMRTRQHY
jgi:hypothetical protein